jgi:hypothetical protein
VPGASLSARPFGVLPRKCALAPLFVALAIVIAFAFVSSPASALEIDGGTSSSAAVDGGPNPNRFGSSEVGRKRNAQNVQMLDERWINDLADEPLLLRVERQKDDVTIALYAMTSSAHADAGPVYVERMRTIVPGARTLDKVWPVDLGSQGHAWAVQAREDDPDDQPVVLTVLGKGPRVLFQDSYLADAEPAERAISLADVPAGFAFHDIDNDGVPELFVSAQSKWLHVEGAQGPAQVEVGRHQKVYRLKDGRYQLFAERYVDFLGALPLSAPSQPKLVDDDPNTWAALAAGQSVHLKLSSGAHPVRLVRLVMSCPASGNRTKVPGSVSAFHLALETDGSANANPNAPLTFAQGKLANDPRVLGSGEFTLGPSGGRQQLIFFEPPISLSALTLTVDATEPKGASGCLSEISAH